MTEGLIDDKLEGFRAGKGCVDQIFTLKQIGEKAREKKCRVYVRFLDLEEGYDRFNREALLQVLRMYDVGGKLLNGIRSMYINSVAVLEIHGGGDGYIRSVDLKTAHGIISRPVKLLYPLELSCEDFRSPTGGRNIRKAAAAALKNLRVQ